MKLTSVFDNIYLKKIWLNPEGGTESGPGSDIKYGKVFVQYLITYISEFKIKSILDVGCGDLNLMKHVLKNIQVMYTGLDVSKVVIDKNIINYPNYRFQCGVLSSSNIIAHKYQLCIIKDVLQHISNDTIFEILSHLYKFKHVIIVNDYKEVNEECENGGYRGLDLKKPPFNVKPSHTFLYQSYNYSKEVITLCQI